MQYFMEWMRKMKNRLKSLFSYYKPYWKLFFADMCFAITGAAVTLILPLIVRYITMEVVYKELSQVTKIIMTLGIIMILLVIVEFGCNYFMTYYGHVMGAKMETNMRSDIFAHYQKLSFSFYDDQKVGALLSRITSDLFDITELLHHGPEDLIISIIKILGSFLILVNINARLTMVAFAFIPVMILFAGYYNRKMKTAFRRNRARMADINTQIEDSLSGIRVVKSFANEEIEMQKFEKGNDGFLQSKRLSYKYMGGYYSGLGALTTMITVLVLIVGGKYLALQTIAAADLVTFLLYINNFIEPVKKLINFTEMFQNGYSGYERFLEILAVRPDIKDEEDAVSIGRLDGKIEFKDVSFCYGENQENVLENINLNIKAGEYAALVGPSGSGKTTLCSLIPRFYERTKGEILIDGIDISHMKLKELRNNVGIVQQDVYLFVGTIMENIRYGKPDATDEEVIRAAKNANAHEFIMSFPDGYLTDIGQRGVKLSGGQKQRLSIARVFLKNPSILIFDEATSALDNESEKIVQQSLEELAKDRTTIVIAHRLSTIRNADRILVLTEHGIKEQGTHEELMDQKGVYEKLYKMQFR